MVTFRATCSALRTAPNYCARGSNEYAVTSARPGTRSLIAGSDFGGAALGGAFALVFVENFLAQTQVLRRGFDVYVGADIFESAFKAEAERRVELDAFPV